MKAISLYQPWASLMVFGLKAIETRSWPTKYRGPLAIHAAKKLGTIPDVYSLDMICFALGLYPIELPRGGIIGTVDLIDCSRLTGNILPEEPERSFGDYRPGRYMWLTKNPKAFKKIIPFRGMQGLFNIPDEALRVCRVCGCSEFNACGAECVWVEKDLCSACIGVDTVYGPSKLLSLLPVWKVRSEVER